jgi:hypothetical protein
MSFRKEEDIPRKKLIVAIAVALAAADILAATLPGYLACADKPAKADAVVLFIGFDSRARMQEALREHPHRGPGGETHHGPARLPVGALFVSSPGHMRRIRVKE